MLGSDLAAGRLLIPFPAITVSRTGYVALVPLHADKSSVLTDFVDWLVTEGTREGRDRTRT